MAHITEDGRCSHCGWGGPDWDEVDVLAWHWGERPEDVYWQQWRYHLEAHRDEPPLLILEGVLAEVRAVLWLSSIVARQGV